MKRTAVYPQPHHDTDGTRVVGQAGGMLLTRTAIVSGLAAGFSRVLLPWRKRWRSTIRARSCATWRSAFPWEATASRMPPWCAPSRPCTGRWLRTDDLQVDHHVGRRYPERVEGDRRRPQRSPVSMPRPTPWMSNTRWSLTWTPPWSPDIRTMNTRHPRSRGVTGSTRCACSSTTVRRAPVNPWRSCCDPARPAATPPKTHVRPSQNPDSDPPRAHQLRNPGDPDDLRDNGRGLGQPRGLSTGPEVAAAASFCRYSGSQVKADRGFEGQKDTP